MSYHSYKPPNYRRNAKSLKKAQTNRILLTLKHSYRLRVNNFISKYKGYQTYWKWYITDQMRERKKRQINDFRHFNNGS